MSDFFIYSKAQFCKLMALSLAMFKIVISAYSTWIRRTR